MDVGSSFCVSESKADGLGKRCIWIFAKVMIIVLGFASPSVAASFEVNSSADDVDSAVGDGACSTVAGSCTLRAALEEAQTTDPGEAVAINFAENVKEIVVALALPAMSRPASITGNSTGDGPFPVIDGRDVPGGSGLTLRAGGSVSDLTVVGFPGYGVVLRNGEITGSRLGVMPDGITVRPNQSGGLNALGATVVGGPRTNGESCTGPCNLIAGNRDSQVNISEMGTVIIGNQIGVLADGTLASGTRDVIRLPGGTLVPTAMVTIGGSEANANLIAAPAGAYSVRVFRALGPASQSVRIGENTFVGPGTLLVDLDLGGQLPNDSGDGDAGPNGLLNFPYLRTAAVSSGCSLSLELITASARTVDAWLVLNNGRIEHALTIAEGSAGDMSADVDSYSDPQLGADSGSVLATSINLRPFAAASQIIFVASDALSNSSESVVFELPAGTEECTSVCFSDRDGDGATGTKEQIVSGQCSDVSTNGTAWTNQSGGDCVDEPSQRCASASAPGNDEICDGCDNDCDGSIDDDDEDIETGDPAVTGAPLARYYPDSDDDGCGILQGSGFFACEPVDGFANNQLDRDDTDGVCCGNGVLDLGEECDRVAIGSAMCTDGTSGVPVCLNDPRHPNSQDTCNFGSGTPNGCGVATTCFADLDGDGITGTIVALDAADARQCPDVSSGPLDTPWTADFGGDCEDQPEIACALDTFPGATEVCDGCDNDCDPTTDDGAGEDTFGLPCDGEDLDLCPEGTVRCGPVSHQLECLDVSDTTVELCDEAGVDEDCDGLVNSADPSIRNLPDDQRAVVYADADGDGCGSSDDLAYICAGETIPEGFTDNPNDQDDTDGDCCGDGLITGEEECDIGLDVPFCSELGAGEGLTTCEVDCTLTFGGCSASECGDGVLTGTETCDPESEFAPDNCRANCTYCGDGILDDNAGESCDPLASNAPDNCRADCTYCGDGEVDDEAGETCDPAAPGAPAFCDPVTCTTCGDGVLETEFGEECDDGAANSDSCEYGEVECDVCSTTCAAIDGEIQRCGDGVVQSEQGETCDDGNTITEACDGPSCSVCTANCKLVSGADPRCGDGVVQSFVGEDCEPGIGDSDVACNDDCTLTNLGEESSGDTGGCSSSTRQWRSSTSMLMLVGLLGVAVRRRRTQRENV